MFLRMKFSFFAGKSECARTHASWHFDLDKAQVKEFRQVNSIHSCVHIHMLDQKKLPSLVNVGRKNVSPSYLSVLHLKKVLAGERF
jgi:hypothetical protein